MRAMSQDHPGAGGMGGAGGGGSANDGGASALANKFGGHQAPGAKGKGGGGAPPGEIDPKSNDSSAFASAMGYSAGPDVRFKGSTSNIMGRDYR